MHHRSWHSEDSKEELTSLEDNSPDDLSVVSFGNASQDQMELLFFGFMENIKSNYESPLLFTQWILLKWDPYFVMVHIIFNERIETNRKYDMAKYA